MTEVETVTVIRKAAWALLWDEPAQAIRYGRNVDIAFSPTGILSVGPTYAGAVSREIDGTALLVMPGLINTHYHSTITMIRKGVTEDAANPFIPTWYHRLLVLGCDDEMSRPSTALGIGRLLLGGTTTVVDWSAPYDGWLDTLATSGARCYAAPYFSSADFDVEEGRAVAYRWHRDEGRAAFDAALDCIGDAAVHPCGRLGGVVAPGELEACSETLLRDSVAVARDRGLPFHVHAAEAPREFWELARRYGKTPVQWAHSLGLLGESTALGHAIYLDSHPQIAWPTKRDMSLIAETGTTITHCPMMYALDGLKLIPLGEYVRAGVNVALGTDSHGHGLIEEIKWAILSNRMMSMSDSGTPTHGIEGAFHLDLADVVAAATVGGARFLGRSDLGRLAEGCKADLFTVDLNHIDMRPTRDPIRNLAYYAGDRAVKDVFVDGAMVVEDGKLLTLDLHDLAGRMREQQIRMEARVPGKAAAGGFPSEAFWPQTF